MGGFGWSRTALNRGCGSATDWYLLIGRPTIQDQLQSRSGQHVNPKYGATPENLVSTHINDQKAPYHGKLVNVGVRDATYVLDGLLYHESDLQILEPYTGTAGFTDHVFALKTLLRFRFAPRIRDLDTTRIYSPEKTQYPALSPSSAAPSTLNSSKTLEGNPTSISLRQTLHRHRIADAAQARRLPTPKRPRESPPRIRPARRTLFILDWTQNPDLRQRVTAGLNRRRGPQHPRACRVFQPPRRDPRPFLRAAILPALRIDTAHRCHRVLEHHLPRRRNQLAGRIRETRTRATTPPLTPWLERNSSQATTRGGTPPNPENSGPCAPEASDHTPAHQITAAPYDTRDPFLQRPLMVFAQKLQRVNASGVHLP